LFLVWGFFNFKFLKWLLLIHDKEWQKLNYQNQRIFNYQNQGKCPLTFIVDINFKCLFIVIL